MLFLKPLLQGVEIVPRNGSKTLGEGLEQVRQWKASKWLWNKELYIE